MQHNSGEHGDIEQKAQYGRDQVVSLVLRLLNDRNLPDDGEIDPALFQDEEFQQLYDTIRDLRDLSASLSRGDLKHFVYSKGYVLSGLKALQGNLRHLTWQTQEIAKGDFSQKVDFLGEFSASFNEMVDKLADMTEQLRRLASIDALTQIPNRQSIEQFFEVAFRKAKEKGTPLSLLVADIDLFKDVNDTYGHPVGDEVLKKVSEVLTSQFRATDMFARFGGEEFLAVLPGTPLDKALQIAERSLKAVAGAQVAAVNCGETHQISVTISIGCSEMREGDQDCRQMIARTDQALYEAKRTGRNRVCRA